MGLGDVIKNQRHKQMEHFGVLFIVLTLCFVGVCVLCAVYQNADDKARDAEQAVYTTGFKTSRSGVEGQVVGICTDDAYKHCVVLMKLKDMKNMPINASSYQGFLAVASNDGNHQYALEDNVTGSIYVYGNSGYIAVYLSNPDGFDAKHLYLMMQNLRPMSTATERGARAGDMDVWSVIFNAGATGTYKSKTLATDKFDAQAFYADTLLVSKEKQTKRATEADLILLQDDIRSIIEWKDRCSDAGIDMSDSLPADIQGDIVVTDKNNNLELQTQHDAPGAIHIDWRNGSILTGYLPDNVDTSSTAALSDYIMKQADTAKTTTLEDMSKHKWVTKTGETINLNDDGSNVIRQEMIEDIRSYVKAVETYRADKSRYQVDDMLAFVSLELDYNQVGRTLTVNVGMTEQPAVVLAK